MRESPNVRIFNIREDNNIGWIIVCEYDFFGNYISDYPKRQD